MPRGDTGLRILCMLRIDDNQEMSRVSAFKRCALAGVVLSVLFVTGCGRSKVVTEVKADGSFTRTMTITGQASEEGAMQMGPKLEEILPAPAGWTVKEEKKKSDRIITATKTFKAGEISKGDVTINESPKQRALTNEISIRQVGPNRFEYREVLHWVGEKPKDTEVPAKEMAELKAALPPALATDANIRGLSKKVAELAFPVLFGPGDPMLSIGLMHPDLAERRMMQRMAGVVNEALQQQFGDQLPAAKRREIARKVIGTSFTSAMQSDRMKPQPPGMAAPSDEPAKKSGPGAFVPLMFVLKAPGKIVETNGEFDELSGEVFWAMFSEAAAFKDVVLTATFEKTP